MSEKFSTVTVGGVDFPLPVIASDWEYRTEPCRVKRIMASCEGIAERHRRDPDLTIVHEWCADASCEICNRVFEGK